MAKKQIHELSALPSAPATGNVLAIDTGTVTYKIDYNALANAIISKLGGDPVTVGHGGTGAITAADARTNLGINGEDIPLISAPLTLTNSASIQYTTDAAKVFTQYKYVDLYFTIQAGYLAVQRIFPNNSERTHKLGFLALNNGDGGVRTVACVFTTAGRYLTTCKVKMSNNNGTFSDQDTVLNLIKAVGYKTPTW